MFPGVLNRGGGETKVEASGLAIASLVLGILGLLTSVVLVGGVLAIVGLILGILYLRRGEERRRTMARTGVGLSVVGLVIAGVVLMFVSSMMQTMRGMGGPRKPPAVVAATGKEAPELEVTTLSGDVVQLSAFRGKRVVVNFWASWLPASVRQVPHFKRLRQEIPEEELAIVAISGEERGVLEAFVAEQEINYLVARSARGVLPAPYNQVEMLPTTFYVNAEGVVDHVSVGYRNFESIKAWALGKAPAGGDPRAGQRR